MLRTVLIVDDHAAFRDAARAILETDGFTVVAEAADLAEAVDAARTSRPAVAVVDIGLGQHDGFEVTEAMLSVHSDMRVVLVSNRARADIERRLERSQAWGFLAKEELTPHALRELLAG